MKWNRPNGPWLAVAAVAAALLMPSAELPAQIAVTLEMNKKMFVAYEPVLATVVVANRAGKDVVLGDTNGRSWLSFQVSQLGGDQIQPYRGVPRSEPRVLGAGKSVRETISLGQYYPLGGQGDYSVRAAVFFNEFGQHFGSNTSAIRVTEGARFWEQQVGVQLPSGQTAYRRYTLLSFQEDDRMSVFVRVRDERSQRVIATYSLGRLVPHRDPQATLDGENRLHVLFLTGPRYFRHCVIDPEGEKRQEQIFQEKDGSFPALMVASTGAVRVQGGVVFDPNAPPERPREVIHRLTDRPPGTPSEN